MKKLFLVAGIIAFGFASAQIEKGRVMVGGELSYSGQRENQTEFERDSYSFVPQASVFVADNLAIGLGVGYTDAQSKDVNPLGYTKNSESGVIVEPFARKYWTLGEKLYFFGQLSVPMVFGCDTEKQVFNNFPDDNTTSEAKYNSFGVSIKPGLTYFLNRNWSLDATIGNFGYSTKKYDIEGAKSTDNINVGLDLKSVSFGVKYVFGKNQSK